MSCIKVLIVFPVGAFYFAVMSGGEGLDFTMLNVKVFQFFLKHREIIVCLAVTKTFCELKSIIRLDALDLEGEGFQQMLQKYCR